MQRKNRKSDRECSICLAPIFWGSHYESRGKMSMCLSCVESPPEVRAGILNHSSSGLQQCHECYEFFEFLGSHIHIHDLTAEEYKEVWGLNRQTPLMSEDRRNDQKRVAKRNQERGKFPSGDVGKLLLKAVRKQGSNITSARLQERLKRSEKLKKDNPLHRPEVREKHRLSVRTKLYKKLDK